MNKEDIIQQIIVVRKDLIELSESEINKLSSEKLKTYLNELETTGKMNRGKIAAQVSHASMGVLLKKMRNGVSLENYKAPETNYDLVLQVEKNTDFAYWIENEFRKIVLYCKNEEALLNLKSELENNNILYCEIRDKGYTAFNGKETLTCIGIEPLKKSILNQFTKKFQILK